VAAHFIYVSGSVANRQAASDDRSSPEGESGSLSYGGWIQEWSNAIARNMR
jgi:hypothetical protein